MLVLLAEFLGMSNARSTRLLLLTAMRSSGGVLGAAPSDTDSSGWPSAAACYACCSSSGFDVALAYDVISTTWTS